MRKIRHFEYGGDKVILKLRQVCVTQGCANTRQMSNIEF